MEYCSKIITMDDKYDETNGLKIELDISTKYTNKLRNHYEHTEIIRTTRIYTNKFYILLLLNIYHSLVTTFPYE